MPRQPHLVQAAKGIIQFQNDADLRTALKTIEMFSHLWIVFVFHQHGGKNWKPSIRPPRLGGRTKVGVLASRSPHRPNPIGMSVVKIESVDLQAPEGPRIVIAGLDLLDGTPVIDVKPYIPYADIIENATSGWAQESIAKYPVALSDEASEFLKKIAPENPELRELIIQILEIDPRPAYQKREFPIEAPISQGQNYGIEIAGFEVKYRIENSQIKILSLFRAEPKS